MAALQRAALSVSVASPSQRALDAAVARKNSTEERSAVVSRSNSDAEKHGVSDRAPRLTSPPGTYRVTMKCLCDPVLLKVFNGLYDYAVLYEYIVVLDN